MTPSNTLGSPGDLPEVSSEIIPALAPWAIDTDCMKFFSAVTIASISAGSVDSKCAETVTFPTGVKVKGKASKKEK